MTDKHTWQPIETAPKDKGVLIAITNSCGKHRTIKAMYFSRYMHEGHEEFSEYCEERDEYFAPEGWYEDIYSETGMDCGYIFLGENPTHWRPLPKPPGEEDATPSKIDALVEALS